MTKLKRTLALSISIMLSATLLTACGSTAPEATGDVTPSTDTSTQESTTTTEDTSSTEGGTRIIIDHGDNEVELPAEINRVVITSIFPLPSVYSLFDGEGEKLVGMHPSSMAAAENSILPLVAPNILNADTSFIQDTTINIEQLLMLEPDVVFTSTTNGEENQKIRDAGIAVVEFSTNKWDFNCIQTFENWILLLGEVFNQEDQAAGIAAYGYEVESEILARLAGLTPEETPSAMVLFNYSESTMTTSGATHFGEYWMNTTGATNVASELSGTPEINMEQVYAWDPDIIYITNFSSVLPEDLLNNTIDGHDWSSVTAVQEGNVYKFPLGMYRWYPPASDTPLVLWWLAKQNQPELFEDIDMDAKVLEYYERFYNVSLTAEQLETIYNPAREAAG